MVIAICTPVTVNVQRFHVAAVFPTIVCVPLIANHVVVHGLAVQNPVIVVGNVFSDTLVLGIV
jgi:hypothetical protein